MTKLTKALNAPPELQTTNPTQVLIDIEDFKESAIAWAKHQLDTDKNRPISILDVKEVKDLTSIVTNIEATYRAKDDDDAKGVTVNVLVQNIVDRFKDDC